MQVKLSNEVAVIRLMLVVRQPNARQALRMWLSAEPDLAVVGDACDCESAVAAAGALHPDIALVVDLGSLCAQEGARRAGLETLCGMTGVIVLTLQDEASACACAAFPNVAALVGTLRPVDTLLLTIRRVAQDRAIAQGG